MHHLLQADRERRRVRQVAILHQNTQSKKVNKNSLSNHCNISISLYLASPSIPKKPPKIMGGDKGRRKRRRRKRRNRVKHSHEQAPNRTGCSHRTAAPLTATTTQQSGTSLQEGWFQYKKHMRSRNGHEVHLKKKKSGRDCTMGDSH